jgi:hypothetical protein
MATVVVIRVLVRVFNDTSHHAHFQQRCTIQLYQGIQIDAHERASLPNFGLLVSEVSTDTERSTYQYQIHPNRNVRKLISLMDQWALMEEETNKTTQEKVGHTAEQNPLNRVSLNSM